MSLQTQLPSLHIPRKPPSPSRARKSTDLSLSQRRNIKRTNDDSVSASDGSVLPRADSKLSAIASDTAASISQRHMLIRPPYDLNKPLPPLPGGARKISYSEPVKSNGVIATLDPGAGRKSGSVPKKGFLRSIKKMVTIKRRASKTKAEKNPQPINYVDKGTQTEPGLWQPTQVVKKAEADRMSSEIAAIQQYHASVKAGHDPEYPQRILRPSIGNMKSLQSFLKKTSPSRPGTPTPVEDTYSGRSLSEDTISPMPNIVRGVLYTPAETPGEEKVAIKFSANLKSPPLSLSPPSADDSLKSVGTYESQYSIHSGPAPDRGRLPGASNPNAVVQSLQSHHVPVDPRAVPHADEAMSVLRPPARRGVSEMQMPMDTPSERETIPPLVRPPTPMTEAPASAPPLHPPSHPSPPRDQRHLPRQPYHLPAKGRQVELRKGSPSRQSPLRQQFSADDPPPLTLQKTASSTGTTLLAGSLDRSPGPRLSPSFYDHHARAAKQGLPPDAFIPPPTPPPEDVVFRRPVYDYFSSAEGKATKQKQEIMPHVPDHLQNSALCPHHPRHRGGQRDFCPIHGTLRTSESSSDLEMQPRRASTQTESESLGKTSNGTADSSRRTSSGTQGDGSRRTSGQTRGSMKTARSRESDGASDTDETVKAMSGVNGHTEAEQPGHEAETDGVPSISASSPRGRRASTPRQLNGSRSPLSREEVQGITALVAQTGARSGWHCINGHSSSQSRVQDDSVESWNTRRAWGPSWSVKEEVEKIESRGRPRWRSWDKQSMVFARDEY